MTHTIHVGDCLEWLRSLPDNSVDSVVTDPPYGLGREPDAREVLRAWLDGEEYKPGGSGFMGRAWDAFVPSPPVWAECLRVLKPGGHLLAFAGTRTYDWIVMGVRLAGFEVRDMVGYLYGTGFPKSLDVSKAIDKQRHDRAEIHQVTEWIRAARDAAGVTNRQIDDAFGFHGMAGHWTSSGSQAAIPTLEQIPRLLAVLGLTLDDAPDTVRDLIWTLNGRKGQPGAAWFDREVIGTAPSSLGGTVAAGDRDPDYIAKHRNHHFNITAPATEAARQWAGWGTALKPSIEPVVMARKPLAGTVAANVLEWGTGGINVDGCRIAAEPWTRPGSNAVGGVYGDFGNDTGRTGSPSGRWPANIIHDGSPEVLAVFPQQKSGGFSQGMIQHSRACNVAKGAEAERVRDARAPDSGSAARFYYCAKASRAEREHGLDALPRGIVDPTRAEDSAGRDNPRAGAGRSGSGRANIHPTVKPVDLMRYLLRLVTPPGGLTIDPYAGSGTTGVAAVHEGFRFAGCELETPHALIAVTRIAQAVTDEREERELATMQQTLF